MKSAAQSLLSLNNILRYYKHVPDGYWQIDYPINDFSGALRCYYLDLSKKYLLFTGKCDPSGIPMYKELKGGRDIYGYSVIEVAQYALGVHQVYLSGGDLQCLEKMKRIADWLCATQENGVWINRYSAPHYGLEKPWVSALTQAFGISALVRAYIETNDEEYLSGAMRATDIFWIAKDLGGVAVMNERREVVFLEEYQTEKPSYVLNGHIFALFALCDLVKITKNEKLNELYEYMVIRLKRDISKWDIGYWSRYDRWEGQYNVASAYYHKLHIKQLRILASLSGEVAFAQWAEKWERKSKNVLYASAALFCKVVMKGSRSKMIRR